MGMLRAVLLFGSGAIALALAVAPMAERMTRENLTEARISADLDMISTGSVAPRGGRYTLRKSVLQASPQSVCVLRANGRRSGDC